MGELMVKDGAAGSVPKQAEAAVKEVFFRPVVWRSAFEETVRRLEQAIRLGAISPGEALPSERELVERLHVSRTTVREALRALQQTGHVQTKRGRTGGTFAASKGRRISSKRDAQRLAAEAGRGLWDAFDFRALIEPKAAALAAERADERAVDRLTTLLNRWSQADIGHLRQIDAALHVGIAAATNSPLLLEAIIDVQLELDDFLSFLVVVPSPDVEARRTSRDHRAIVEAIANRMPELAHAAMEQHVLGTESVLRGLLSERKKRATGREEAV
jgi:DNA-binding FadR family transcriptional regulator